MHNRAKNSYN